MSIDKIDNLIEKLASEQVGEYCENTYLTDFKRDNLKLYLHKMLEANPDTLLVGEALGFKGCGQTGIPFTSEFILNSKGDDGFKTQANTNALTCTIVHEILKVYEFTPIMWNIYPFRPFRKGEPLTNRPPNFEEVQVGMKYIEDLLNIFNISNILAVGKVSYKALSEIYPDTLYIRHPSNGGKLDFVSGINEFIQQQKRLSRLIPTI